MHAREMIGTHPAVQGQINDALIRCIEECYSCAQTCTSCADACLSERMVQELTQCIRLPGIGTRHGALKRARRPCELPARWPDCRLREGEAGVLMNDSIPKIPSSYKDACIAPLSCRLNPATAQEARQGRERFPAGAVEAGVTAGDGPAPHARRSGTDNPFAVLVRSKPKRRPPRCLHPVHKTRCCLHRYAWRAARRWPHLFTFHRPGGSWSGGGVMTRPMDNRSNCVAARLTTSPEPASSFGSI